VANIASEFDKVRGLSVEWTTASKSEDDQVCLCLSKKPTSVLLLVGRFTGELRYYDDIEIRSGFVFFQKLPELANQIGMDLLCLGFAIGSYSDRDAHLPFSRAWNPAKYPPAAQRQNGCQSRERDGMDCALRG